MVLLTDGGPHGLAKHPQLPDLGVHERREDAAADEAIGGQVIDHPHWDRDEIHSIFRRWRQIADSYATSPGGRRMLVAEAWRIRAGGLSRYLRRDELHSAFSFDFLKYPWDPVVMRKVIEQQITLHARVDAVPSWVLSSHDLRRPVTRYGLDVDWGARRLGEDTGAVDLGVGIRRARAAALLMLALPGSAYVYQGEHPVHRQLRRRRSSRPCKS